MKKILIIEDDRALGEGIALGLGTNTYEFTRCETLKEAEEAWEKEAFDLVILDLNLPDGSGYPFHLAVLRARIQNLLRMTAKEDKSVYEDARFRFDFAKLYYQKDGQTVVLSNTEQKLLKLLVDNQKTTLSRQMLIDRVWTDGAEYVDENALSVAISRLRNKLEDTLSRPMFIQNVYGIGYVWQPAKEKTWRG